MLNREHTPHGSDVNLAGRIFIGLVVDNMDQKAMERVKIRVIGVHDMENTDVKNAVWAQRMVWSKYVSGHIPDPGDFVYCMFMDPNDPMSLLWMGYVRSML
jgi:hypothetical protein